MLAETRAHFNRATIEPTGERRPSTRPNRKVPFGAFLFYSAVSTWPIAALTATCEAAVHSRPLPGTDYRPPDLPPLPPTAAPGAPATRREELQAARFLPTAYLALTGLAWVLTAVFEVSGIAGFRSWSIPVVEVALAAIALSAAVGAGRRWRLAPAFFSWLGLFTGGWAGLRVVASGVRYIPLLVLSAGLLVVGLVLWLRGRSDHSSANHTRPGFDGPNDDPYIARPHTQQELLELGRDRLPPL